MKHPKFYFIDNEIARAAARNIGAQLVPGTTSYGQAFENYINSEAYKALHYKKKEAILSFFNTSDGARCSYTINPY